MVNLNCGCGPNIIKGWVNIDNLDASSFSPTANISEIVKHDLSKGIPYEDSTVDTVFSEHFLEHMTLAQIEHFVKESFRVLKPGGVFRASTPDLKQICLSYVFGDMSLFRKLGMADSEPATLVNRGMRDWGHKHVLDQKQMKRILEQAGFKGIIFEKHGISQHSHLINLETRQPGLDFVVEAIK